MTTPTYTDPLTQNLSDLIEDVAASFTQSTASQRVIQESFFLGIFLPMFAGDENPVHKATPEMWYNVAHGPFNEVTVVDAQGQFLFSVPALASQSAIKPLDGTGPSARMSTVTDMIRTARLYSARGPQVVDGIIRTELDKRAFLFEQSEMSQENIARWNAIFARYDRPLLPINATLTPSSSTHVDPARDSTEFDPI